MGPKHLRISIEAATPIFEFLSRPENADKSTKAIANEMLALGFAAKDPRSMQLYVRRAKHKFRWGLTVRLTIKKMRRDAGLQPRAELDSAVVNDYAIKMKAGVPFVPVTVFFDGTYYWLADGFHRAAAALQAGIKSLNAEVIQGNKRDAKLFAAGANAEHGLRRSETDKRRAIRSLLTDEEWGQSSDEWIAGKCKVSPTYVASTRRELGISTPNTVWSQPTRKTSSGRTINTSNIGKNPNSRRKPKTASVATETSTERPSPEQEELAEFVAETNGVYRDAEPEASTNGYHEPEDEPVGTAVTDDDGPLPDEPWLVGMDPDDLIDAIARSLQPDALYRLLSGLASRAGYVLVPANKG